MGFFSFIYRVFMLIGFLSTALVVGYIALPFKSERVEAAIAEAKQSAEVLRDEFLPARYRSQSDDAQHNREDISPEWNSNFPPFRPPGPRQPSQPRFELNKEPPDPQLPPSLPLPEHGMSHVVHSRPTPNALEITNPSPVLHSLIKLEDAETGQLLSKHFVRAGQSLTIDAPDGVMRAKVASGRQWEGEPYFFGDETIFYYMSGPITFSNGDGFYYLAYEINVITHTELIKRPFKREEW